MKTDKNKLLEEFNNSPIQIGETIYFIDDYNKKTSGTVSSIEEKGVWVSRYNYINEIFVEYSKITGRLSVINVGYNPMFNMASMSTWSYTLTSILFNFRGNHDIAPELNWNPYVTDNNGNKHYYQRDFCWTIEEKQNLIRSLYNGLSIGRILVRKRSYEWVAKEVTNGNLEVGFFDIIDGKQRLKTLYEWENNEFPDSDGYYYDDLSTNARKQILNSQQLGYCELHPNTTDEQVLDSFIRSNVGGIPVSVEHIKMVEELYTNIFKK